MTTISEQLAIIDAAQAAIDATQEAKNQAQEAYSNALTIRDAARAALVTAQEQEAVAYRAMLAAQLEEQETIDAAQARIDEARKQIDLLAYPPPTYALSSSAAEVDEGTELSISLITTNLVAGTLIPFVVSGVAQEDLTTGSLTGTFLIDAQGQGVQHFTIKNDSLTEGSEDFHLALPDLDTFIDVTVRDTSQTPPPPPPTYALSSASLVADEGQSVVIELQTTSLAEGVLVPYTVTGVQPEDVLTGNLTGSFFIDALGHSVVNIGVVADALTEGDETLVLTLDGRSESISVLIRDTSVTPVPPPPAVDDLGVVHKEFVILSRIINFEDMHDRYLRWQVYREIDGTLTTKAKIRITGADLSGGGLYRALAAPSYTLYFENVDDGKGPFPVATVNVPSPVYYTDFLVDAANPDLEDRWYKMTLGDLSASNESCYSYWVRVIKALPVVDTPWNPAVKGHYERVAHEPSVNAWAKVPGTPSPVAEPLLRIPDRNAIPSPALNRAELHCDYLVPIRWGDTHRPVRSKKGGRSTFSYHQYYWSQLHAKLPGVPLLDGPRGVGALAMVTHIEVGTANVYTEGNPYFAPTPDGFTFIGNYYGTSPWSVFKMKGDGRIVTMAGWTMVEMPQWQDGVKDGLTYQDGLRWALKLVGDWSAIPVERRGFWELWGMTWDTRFNGSNDNTGTPSPLPYPQDPERGLKPHAPGLEPVIYVADSQNGRICKLKLPNTHFNYDLTVVTEPFVNLQDPWDCVMQPGTPRLFVSERKAHRIVEFDVDTGQMVRVVVQGQPLATIDINREVIVSGTLDQRRAVPCVAPEGLFLQDDWLYFASKAQAQIRRVHIDTGEMQVVHNILIDANSKYAKIALSDGTFGARGTTFTWTWSNQYVSGPEIHGPDGVQIQQLWRQGGGTGDWTPHGSYGTAGCAQAGRLVTCGMVEGAKLVSKSRPGDLPWTAATERGHAEYREKLYHATLGEAGFRYYDRPLPWGESVDMDAYLALQHIKPV